MTSQHVLLAGCGDVGIATGLRMIAQGWSATGVRRRAALLPAEVSGLALDLTTAREGDLPRADAVVVTLTADSTDANAYERTYVNGLRGLARALPRDEGGAEPLVVLVSSTGVFGQNDGEIVTEATDPSPSRETAKILRAAELLAMELFPRLVIVRPAGIYGPGRTSLADRVARGEPVARNRMTNRIHRDDLVSVIESVLGTENPPELVHAVDHSPAPLGAVADHIAGLLGVPAPPDVSGSGGGRGKSIDGSLVRSLTDFRYPSYREGYASLLG